MSVWIEGTDPYDEAPDVPNCEYPVAPNIWPVGLLAVFALIAVAVMLMLRNGGTP